MPTEDELFTPTEVLSGFSAKRARLLLFQIECRTAYLMRQARQRSEKEFEVVGFVVGLALIMITVRDKVSVHGSNCSPTSRC